MEKITTDSVYKGLSDSAGCLDVEISVKDPKHQKSMIFLSMMKIMLNKLS